MNFFPPHNNYSTIKSTIWNKTTVKWIYYTCTKKVILCYCAIIDLFSYFSGSIFQVSVWQVSSSLAASKKTTRCDHRRSHFGKVVANHTQSLGPLYFPGPLIAFLQPLVNNGFDYNKLIIGSYVVSKATVLTAISKF